MNVKWDEPASYLRAVARANGTAPTLRRQVMYGLAAAVVVAVVIPGFESLFYLLHKKDLGVPTYVYFLAPAIAGLFVGYLPSLVLASSAKVNLDENGLHRTRPMGPEVLVQAWPWESIDALAVEDVEVAGGVHRVLVVRLAGAQEETLIGLGQARLEDIKELAGRMGKPLTFKLR